MKENTMTTRKNLSQAGKKARRQLYHKKSDTRWTNNNGLFGTGHLVLKGTPPKKGFPLTKVKKTNVKDNDLSQWQYDKIINKAPLLLAGYDKDECINVQLAGYVCTFRDDRGNRIGQGVAKYPIEYDPNTDDEAAAIFYNSDGYIFSLKQTSLNLIQMYYPNATFEIDVGKLRNKKWYESDGDYYFYIINNDSLFSNTVVGVSLIARIFGHKLCKYYKEGLEEFNNIKIN